MARTDRATLELLHVMTPVVAIPGEGYVSPKIYDELAASAAAWARKRMAALVKQARAAGVEATSTIIEGVPAERIVRAARARRADVIVMGTHGRTGISRLLLGSVVSRVIATAPCPVLTVRGK